MIVNNQALQCRQIGQGFTQEVPSRAQSLPAIHPSKPLAIRPHRLPEVSIPDWAAFNIYCDENQLFNFSNEHPLFGVDVPVPMRAFESNEAFQEDFRIARDLAKG